MKKAIFLNFIFFYICINSYTQQTVSIDNAIRSAGIYLSGNLPHNSKIAILNIQSDNPKISEYILEELSALLVNDRTLVLVDRRDLDLIRQEEQFQKSGEVSDETAQRIGHKLGAQTIISGSFINFGNQYRLRIQAIAVETAQVQGVITAPVKTDKTLRGLTQETVNTNNDTILSSLHDKNRLYLGAKAGLSLGYYDNGGALADKTLYPSQTISGIPSYNASLFISAPIWSLLAIQTEVILTRDTFELFSGNNSLMTVSYNSLMIPLLVKLVWRPSIFMLQGYTGAYLSIPLGQAEIKHRNGSYTADLSLLSGFMAGGGLGIKLGYGSIIADIRYATDFSYIKANNSGRTFDLSHGNKVHFTLGYEIGILPKLT